MIGQLVQDDFGKHNPGRKIRGQARSRKHPRGQRMYSPSIWSPCFSRCLMFSKLFQGAMPHTRRHADGRTERRPRKRFAGRQTQFISLLRIGFPSLTLLHFVSPPPRHPLFHTKNIVQQYYYYQYQQTSPFLNQLLMLRFQAKYTLKQFRDCVSSDKKFDIIIAVVCG